MLDKDALEDGASDIESEIGKRKPEKRKRQDSNSTEPRPIPLVRWHTAVDSYRKKPKTKKGGAVEKRPKRNSNVTVENENDVELPKKRQKTDHSENSDFYEDAQKGFGTPESQVISPIKIMETNSLEETLTENKQPNEGEKAIPSTSTDPEPTPQGTKEYKKEDLDILQACFDEFQIDGDLLQINTDIMDSILQIDALKIASGDKPSSGTVDKSSKEDSVNSASVIVQKPSNTDRKEVSNADKPVYNHEGGDVEDGEVVERYASSSRKDSIRIKRVDSNTHYVALGATDMRLKFAPNTRNGEMQVTFYVKGNVGGNSTIKVSMKEFCAIYNNMYQFRRSIDLARGPRNRFIEHVIQLNKALRAGVNNHFDMMFIRYFREGSVSFKGIVFHDKEFRKLSEFFCGDLFKILPGLKSVLNCSMVHGQHNMLECPSCNDF